MGIRVDSTMSLGLVTFMSVGGASALILIQRSMWLPYIRWILVPILVVTSTLIWSSIPVAIGGVAGLPITFDHWIPISIYLLSLPVALIGNSIWALGS